MAAAEIISLYGGHQGPARWKYIVEYRAEDGSDKRVELKQVGKFVRRMITLQPGMTVPLLVDRRSGEVRFDHKNPEINARAVRKQQAENQRHDWSDKLQGR